MYRALSRGLRSYFHFTQGQVNAFLAMLVIMALLLVLPWLVRTLLPAHDPAADKRELDRMVAQLEFPSGPAPAVHDYAVGAPARRPLKPLHPFDPNTLTAAQWQDFGLRPYLAERIVKYRSKGGQFRTREDLQRIYGFPDTLFRQLYPYIQLPDKQSFQAGRYDRKQEREPKQPWPDRNTEAGAAARPARKPFVLAPMDLNLADTAELKRIRGIGSKRALRLVQYRERLGGFLSHQQLHEIWALDSASIDSLRKYTYVENDFSPRKVAVNTVTADELRQHPLLKPHVAKAIVSYREAHGPYRSAEELRKVKLVDEALLRRLAPYLKYD